MTGSLVKSDGPVTAGGLAALDPDELVDVPVVGLPEAAGLPELVGVVEGVLDPHALSTSPATTTTGMRILRTAGQTTHCGRVNARTAMGAPDSVPDRNLGVVVDASRIYSVGDARRRAARAVPRALFDYIDGGADDEVTLRENLQAFREVTFRPRMGVPTGEPRTSTTLVDTPLSTPVLLAPCGLVRFMHPDGAPGVARAASAMGTLSVLSTVAGTSLEDVATSTSGPKWYQLYSPGGRPQTDELVQRAQRAGYTGIVVTIDTPALGHRERDVRHGVTQPFRFSPMSAGRLAAQVALRPRWLAGMARAAIGARASGEVADGPGADSGAPTARLVAMGASPFSWEDVAAIRSPWSGTLAVKGVLTPDDARRAVDAGSDVVIVSNHGGRQLDGAPASFRVLPAIVDALAGDAAVVLDSGIRRGSDVVKALAAGADAVMIGRAYLYGLAAGGEPGVRRILEVLHDEMVRTMSLMGCSSVSDLDRTWLELPDTRSASAASAASDTAGRRAARARRD
jgi:isopentenyl diphosphate isomerase/L-lactate dehydrogenase-like FMN-dependent dehydrogenase